MQNQYRLKELEYAGVLSALREPDEPEILLFSAPTQVCGILVSISYGAEEIIGRFLTL